jgi:c-di-GMP-binding flagellar brake protein YcgR
MFRRGKVLKVKVELSTDVVGFGRATVIDCQSNPNRLFLQLRTSKGEKRTLPKGTRVWFVSDVPNNPFNGLWSTTIVTTRQIEGKTALECTRPKFEAHVQRRKTNRVAISYPLRILTNEYQSLEATTRNISKQGVGIEVYEDCVEQFPLGHNFDILLDTPVGPVEAKVRVIAARFNWLANKTDIGFEYTELADSTKESLEKLVLTVAGQRMAPAGKESSEQRSGHLSQWLKSIKDNVSFAKTAETQPLSEDDLEELTDELHNDNEEAGDDHVTD